MTLELLILLPVPPCAGTRHVLVNYAQFMGVGDYRHTHLTLECDFVLARQVLYSSNRTRVCILHTFFFDTESYYVSQIVLEFTLSPRLAFSF